MLFPARRRLQRCSSWRRNFRIVNSTAQSFAFFQGSDEQRCRRSKTQPTRRFRSGNARFSASMDGLQNTPATSNNDVSTGGTDANGADFIDPIIAARHDDDLSGLKLLPNRAAN